MDNRKMILICENSMEGIFSAVYDGWNECAGGIFVEVRTEVLDHQELFCSYRSISTDPVKAGKVMNTIRRRLGVRVYEDICFAAVSREPDRGTAIYHVLRTALGNGRCNVRIMEAMADPYVNKVSKLRIKVWHEFHRYFGFLRFREIAGAVLLAKIKPENDILEMLGPHFANRFPNENWMIYDEGRNKVLLHPKGQACTLQRDVVLTKEYMTPAGTEEYEELWKAFRKSVTIEERRNPGLLQQMVPLKFRSNMLEFH